MKKRVSEERCGKERSRAERYALLLLKFRPRSIKELQGRLSRKGFERDVTLAVTERLLAQGLLDDREFARWWVRNRTAARPTGMRLLRRELRDKGIEDEEIDRTFSDASLGEDTDYRSARALALKRLSSPAGFTPDKKARARRLFSYLSRRGFSTSAVTRVIRELLSGVSENEE